MTIALTDDEVIQVLMARQGGWTSCIDGNLDTSYHVDTDASPFCYLESRDALAPILESLTRAEWLEVHARLLEQYERECEANRSILPGPWLWLLRLTPRVLAFAIAEVLWKAKG